MTPDERKVAFQQIRDLATSDRSSPPQVVLTVDLLEHVVELLEQIATHAQRTTVTVDDVRVFMGLPKPE